MPKHRQPTRILSRTAAKKTKYISIICTTTGLNILCAHINHNLRGKESDRDEEFVRSLCEKYGIECRVLSANVAEYAEKNRLSTEEAGRKLRYEFFEHCANELGKNAKIANLLPSSLFVLKDRSDVNTGKFYVPYSILTATNQAWSVTITCNVPGYSKILTATGTGSITLPQAASGQQVIYTDGTRVYNPGDTIAYSSTPVNLTAYVK